MSYLVLARKYRPKNFSQMVGQEHVVQALTNALSTGRLHHAYLFTGTRGVGKTTVSRILAKSLNCTGPDGQGGITATPCGVCQACTEIDTGRFVDYTELDAASNRGVDEIQALLEQAVYKPVQGRFKVFMIDEVHMLTNTAFNAMLKTLEEPPEYLKFVLATTDPQKVPVTVLSRCLQFNLRPMAPETVFEHLGAVLEAERIEAEPPAVRLLSRAAHGSMRDGLSLTDQAIAFGNGRLQEEAVRRMLGSVDRSYVFRLIDALARGDGRTVVETSDALRAHGLSAASTLEDMAAVLQRMAVLQAVPDLAAAIDAGDDEARMVARLARRMAADETQLLYSICLHGRGELGLAPDEYAALTMALLRLLAFKPRDTASTVDAEAEPMPSPVATAEKKSLTRPEAARPLPAPLPGAAPASAAEAAPQSPPAPAPPSPAPPPPAAASPAEPAAPATPMPAPRPPSPAPSASVRIPVAREGGSAPEPPPWEDVPDEAYAEDARGMALPGAEDAALPLPPVRSHARPAAGPQPGQDAEPRRVPAPTPPSTAQSAMASAAPLPAFTPDPEHGDFWYGVVQQLIAAEAITALVRELALQSQLVARDGRRWTLRIERGSLDQPVSRERLRATLAAAGHADTLAIEVGPILDSPARRNAAAAQARQREAEELIHNDPFVQQMVREFGARIVPGSIKPLQAA
ncbi:MAG: DNA polymerase III subunit gamma/tau [Xylophilus ampelinus]